MSTASANEDPVSSPPPPEADQAHILENAPKKNTPISPKFTIQGNAPMQDPATARQDDDNAPKDTGSHCLTCKDILSNNMPAHPDGKINLLTYHAYLLCLAIRIFKFQIKHVKDPKKIATLENHIDTLSNYTDIILDLVCLSLDLSRTGEFEKAAGTNDGIVGPTNVTDPLFR